MLNFADSKFVFHLAVGSGRHRGSIFNFLTTSISDEQKSFASGNSIQFFVYLVIRRLFHLTSISI